MPTPDRRRPALVATAASLLTHLLAPSAACQGGVPEALQGRIVDMRGDPVPAAQVEVVATGDRRVIQRTFSDAEGIYHVPRLPEAGVHLRVGGPGKAFCELRWRGPRTPRVRNVVLRDAAMLTGRVTDENGAPVPRAYVTAVVGTESARARTDDAGEYVLEAVPIGPGSVTIWTGRRAAERTLLVRDGARCDLTIDRGRTGACTVRVEGLPAGLAGAFARVIGPDVVLLPNGGVVPLMADGTAQVVLDDTSIVQVHAPGFALDPRGRLASAGSAALRFRARVAERAARTTVRGRMTTFAGKPVGGATIFVNDLSGRHLDTVEVDRRGGFRIELDLPSSALWQAGLALDRWVLDEDERRLRDGCSWLTMSCADDVVHLFVSPTARLTGDVRDAQGTLMAFADVVVADAYRPGLVLLETACDAAGRLDLYLPAAKYDLLATTPDGRVCSGQARPAAKDGMLDVDWKPVETGAAEGVLVDRRGAPLPGVELLFASEDARGPLGVIACARRVVRVRTDRNGRFRCRGLVPGEWTVAATSHAEIDVQRVDVVAGQDAYLTLKPK